MWKLLKDNTQEIIALCAIFTLILTILVFFGKIIFNKVTHNKNSKHQKISMLEKQIIDLKKKLEKYTAIEKSTDGNYIILKETNTPICPTCWGKDKNPIPIYDDGRGKYKCSICGTSEVYSNLGVEKEKEKQNEATNKMAQVCKAHNNYFDRNGYF